MTTVDPVPPVPAEPYRDTAAAVLSALAVDADAGLSAAETQARLARFGKNRLRRQPRKPAWRRFLGQFTDVLVLLLIAAAVVSVMLWLADRESALPYEAITILCIVLLNAVMSYLQQARAEEGVAGAAPDGRTAGDRHPRRREADHRSGPGRAGRRRHCRGRRHRAGGRAADRTPGCRWRRPR